MNYVSSKAASRCISKSGKKTDLEILIFGRGGSQSQEVTEFINFCSVKQFRTKNTNKIEPIMQGCVRKSQHILFRNLFEFTGGLTRKGGFSV